MVLDLDRQGLPAYCLDLLDAVSQHSGHPLRVREEHDLAFDSELRTARPGQPDHVLAYRPEYRAFRTHFVVNAAVKVLRHYAEPPERRYLPTSDANARLPPDEHREFRRRVSPALPDEAVREMSRFMWQGLVRQLTSFPVDLRVEREIAETLPAHADRQRAYFRQQVADLVPHFAPDIAAFAPPRTYRAISAMNVVLGMEASELAGVPEQRAFLKSAHRDLGEVLHADLHAVATPGRAGDYELTDTWADRLGLPGTYVWVK